MDLNELQSLLIRDLTGLAQKLDIKDGVAGLNKQELIYASLKRKLRKKGYFLPVAYLRSCKMAMVFCDLRISTTCQVRTTFM